MSMTSTLHGQPWYRLTSHFFLGLFDFGVLSDAGSDSFRRLLIGIIAAMLTVGLLLARMFMSASSGPTASLTAQTSYRLAAEALVVGLPMLVVAFATLLVSHSLFPDETDFRVLLVLPVSRRVVFLSKLFALALFAGLFIVSAQAAMLPLFLRMSMGGRAEQTFLVRLLAHALASLSASTFVVLALTAMNGVLLMGVPRARLQAASTAVRSAMLCALVLSVPLASRLPTIGPLLAAASPLLYLAPPVWFLGVERWLLGDATPYFVRLTQIAAMAFLSSLVLAVGSYTFLYRRFDQVMLRPADASSGSRRRRASLLERLHARRPNVAAIGHFTHATLARSPLHQGVFVAIAACGAGLLMNSFFGGTGSGWLQLSERALVGTVIWAPFALVFVMNLASRAALVLPIEPRANWVFRITEDGAARAEHLNAVVQTVVRLSVVWPLVVLFPVEWAVLGPRAIPCTAVAWLAGIVLVELHMADWRRIPFTCSYMPGKRFVGHTMLIGFTAFVLFTTIGPGLVWYSIGHRTGWLVVMGVLGAVVLQRRRRRLRLGRQTALVFEDVLPNEVEPLQLSAN